MVLLQKKPDASAILDRDVKLKETVAIRQGIQEDIKYHHIISFSSQMSMFTVHLALTISDCLVQPKMPSEGKYWIALSYLCQDILHDKSLYFHMQASLINDNANATKHSLKANAPVDLDETLDFYNKMVKDLAQKLGLNKLSFFQFSKPAAVDDPFQTKPFEKKCRVYGHDITIILHQNYRLDEYTHVALQKTTIKWDKTSGDKLTYTFFSTTQNCILGTGTEMMDLKQEIHPYINVTEMDSTETPLGRKVQVMVRIQIDHLFLIPKKRKVHYTTGILFWEEEHTKTEEYTENVWGPAETSPLIPLSSYLRFRES
jgi:hypothetical protein